MTYEELKTEANKLGYSLVKKKKYIRFAPCTCGGNRRLLKVVYHFGVPRWMYVCKGCGMSGPIGRTKEEGKILWNWMMLNENGCRKGESND